MDDQYSSPPSFTTPRADPSYSPVNDNHYVETGPQSFSALNRPVSVDQSHLRTIEAYPDTKAPPSIKDVGPHVQNSYKDSMRTIQEGQKLYSREDFAGERKLVSIVDNKATVEEGKIPSVGDFNQNIGSSAGNQEGEYQYIQAPKSYNGDNFGLYY